ncbi:MAG: hypothetical protein AUG51_13210 [Acidobacteria bacterium 13_1_20CM_3_53_8]|nr:MAG: hypothetical protein AUG51_13210 [Acidobacteria bacterium 13_1_20CM_3_53_8]
MSKKISLSQFTHTWRELRFKRLAEERFDVLVIGGGITGAAVALDASCAGLSCALIEQNDFASGTSSRSSRLIHGGLRYLKQGQVGLVYRSAREQQRLALLAPHLVRPLNLLFPLYQKSFTSRLAHRGGMIAYSALQPFDSKLRHQRSGAKDLLSLEPQLPANGLQDGFICREYLTHDARLVLETTLAACNAGACAVNYARVMDLLFLRGRVVGAVVNDEMTGRSFEVRARVVVNAAGPWADRLINRAAQAKRRLRLSKGVHIIIPREILPLSHAVIFFSRRDERALVAIPAENFVMVGPTETEYEGAPECAAPEREDVDYLLEALRDFFSQLKIENEDVIAARAGVRPLYDKGVRAAGEVSRAYHIEWQRDRLLSVLGGKLTLHRRAAAVTTRLLTRELKINPGVARLNATKNPLPGANWKNFSEEETKALLMRLSIEEESADHLIRAYGSRSLLFADMLTEERELARRITPSLPHIAAEVPFSIRYEMAVRPQDFFERRSDLALCLKAEGETWPHELMKFWHEPREKFFRAAQTEEVLA